MIRSRFFVLNWNKVTKFVIFRSGLEQDDISLIYPYLRELVLNNSAPQQSSTQLARFLVDDSIQSRLSRIKATTSSQANQLADNSEEFFEFERVHLEKPQPATYYLIPYNLSRLTFFIFIRVSRSFKLSLLKTIDDLLAPHMIEFAAEIADQQSKRNLIRLIYCLLLIYRSDF